MLAGTIVVGNVVRMDPIDEPKRSIALVEAAATMAATRRILRSISEVVGPSHDLRDRPRVFVAAEPDHLLRGGLVGLLG